ncbi:MAG: UDP-N-acetylglucosamine 1-carboxyvinyltransferase, partial [Clostridia bacterium]|nr:UDP-N-acetylglucosamine 1-carboxyvinyltransferase [Clostridia bacterium]
MEKIVINGGTPLKGSVEISGAKNAVVAILPATLLAQDVCRIENIPDISDVTIMLKILAQLGASVKMINRTTYEIDTRNVNSYIVPNEHTKHLRASYYMLGALLGRFGRAKVSMPGGCWFGVRPIDLHLRGFELLGAEVSIDNAMVNAEANELIGSVVY